MSEPTEQQDAPAEGFDEWLRAGMKAGWCGPAVCQTHDGTPISEPEDDEFMAGDDPCIHILRLYSDDIMRKGVERNHPPSVWRKR